MSDAAFTFLSLVFGLIFYITMATGVGIIAWVFVTVFIKAVRLLFPNFMLSEMERRRLTKAADETREHRRVALDYIIQERLRRINMARHIEREDRVPVAAFVPLVNKTIEKKAPSVEQERATFGIAKLVDGATRYLCQRSIRRSLSGQIEKRFAFAALPTSAIKLDLESATRLWRMPEFDGCFIVGMNAEARMQMRAQEEVKA